MAIGAQGPPRRDYGPDARREALRPEAERHRPGDRGADPDRAVRRRPRRLELQLRRGDPDPESLGRDGQTYGSILEDGPADGVPCISRSRLGLPAVPVGRSRR
jgi:hypothetical protein